MAKVELEETGLSVRLGLGDEILAMHGSLHVPYTHVRAVSTERVPDAWFRGVRFGVNVPGIKVAGTFITDQGMIFYDFHDPTRCLTLELSHEHYRRVVIEVDRDQDPAALAAEIGRHIAGGEG